jgi:dTDP-4-amino-4,6-dideoxygalactose transaminase
LASVTSKSLPERIFALVPFNDLQRQHDATAESLAEAVGRVMRSGRYVASAEVKAFEAAFAAFCGTSHCIGVANGTDALELALRAVGVVRGVRVVTVANAGGYASTAILAIGAVPVYVDIDPHSLLLDVRRLDELRERPAALVVTHLYGRMADMDAIAGWARRSGIPVVEDCAQAHGATRNGRRAGAHGDAGCYSFYPTKNLGALGDGGAIVTHDPDVARRVKALHQYGWSSKYHADIAGGRNSRLDELQAAILSTKLPHVDEWTTRRRAIVAHYREGLNNERIRPPPATDDDDVAHLCVVQVADREPLRAHLARHGIGHDVHYPVPDHRQPAFQAASPDSSLPVTERAAREVLSLPCFPEMTDAEVDEVIECCNDWRN